MKFLFQIYGRGAEAQLHFFSEAELGFWDEIEEHLKDHGEVSDGSALSEFLACHPPQLPDDWTALPPLNGYPDWDAVVAHAVRLRPSGVGAYNAYGDTCIILSDPDAAVTVWRYPDCDAAEKDIRWHVNGRTLPDLEVLLETTVEELFDEEAVELEECARSRKDIGPCVVSVKLIWRRGEALSGIWSGDSPTELRLKSLRTDAGVLGWDPVLSTGAEVDEWDVIADEFC